MKNLRAVLSLILILGFIHYSFYSLMPQKGVAASAPQTEFSSERALIPLKEITKAPHYHGSQEHERVAQYLLKELEKLGLETQVQEGFVHNSGWGGLDKPKNIMGRLKGTGNGKALLLLSHYDSALVPSYGASDAGSGVVTILESLRAYKASGKTPKNDIIVLFTDAEEIGLDGAQLFVNEHPWAKEVGLVLNFEARGSGGPSNMILETNGGNANLIKSFIEANPQYPVASSLMYSIYKMLPNDTDSTVFREDGDIDSFFFAFIDDHYDYHTANDNFDNLDRNTLQHQGSYLLPLVHHFANADLSNLKAEEDHVYVNLPFIKMLSYPFSWILPMLLIAAIILVVLIFYGIKKKRLHASIIGKGFAPFLLTLITCGIIGYFGWILLLKLYPQYNEIQHGFTYNGHTYIAFFVFLSLTILLKVYRKHCKPAAIASLYVAPLTFWIIINAALFAYLKGGAFFIIPVFFGLVSFWLLIKQEKPNLLLLTLLAAPALFIFAPLIQFFPVGLGLEMLVASCIFTVLVFGLLLPVFGFYRWKNILSGLCLLLAIGFFIGAHFTSDFSEKRKKPNSLVYYNNLDSGAAFWATYDKNLDDWTKGYLGDNPEEASKYVENAAGSKYKTGYTYASAAPKKEIPQFETVLQKDTVIDGRRDVTFTIFPKRKINLLNLYADTTLTFQSLQFNGKSVPKDSTGNVYSGRSSNGLLRYYVSGNDSLEVSYSISKERQVHFTIMEYSYDLLENSQFTINKRPKYTMPKPFVVTDAIVVKKTIAIDELPLKIIDTLSQTLLVNE